MKVTILMVLSLIFLLCFPLFCFSQNKIVNDQNFEQIGWEEEQINKYGSIAVRQFTTSHIEIVCGPERMEDIHPGSVLMQLPNGRDTTLRRIRLRNHAYDGTYLKKIAAIASLPGCLQYNTFIVQNQNRSNIDLVLEIDTAADGTIDFNLAFTPSLQHQLYQQYGGFPFPEVTQMTWQTWDAAKGWWVEGLGKPLPDGLDTFRLIDFIHAFPKARIRNSTSGAHAGGGIRFTVGGESADYDDFIGYLDAFIIYKKTNRLTAETWLNKEHELTPVTYNFLKVNPPCRLHNEYFATQHLPGF